MNASRAPDTLRTAAWRLVGLSRSLPGELHLRDGRFRFTTSEGRLFDAPLGDVTDVAFPWYYFGGGMTLRVGREAYRFSFVVPTEEHGSLGDIPEGRRAGKAWQAALTRPR